MNQRLEQYLSEAEQRLHTLPPARRLEEIDEMRQHLAATVQAHEELGLTMDEATEAAVRQFGAVRQVSTSLERAWWREQIGGPRGLWKTAALTVGLVYTMDALLYPVALLRTIPQDASKNYFAFNLLIALLLTVLPAALVGFSLGSVTPRNAVVGALLGRGLCLVYTCVCLGLQGLIPHATFGNVFEATVLGQALQLVTAVLTAWLTVRLGRRRLARQRRQEAR